MLSVNTLQNDDIEDIFVSNMLFTISFEGKPQDYQDDLTPLLLLLQWVC